MTPKKLKPVKAWAVGYPMPGHMFVTEPLKTKEPILFQAVFSDEASARRWLLRLTKEEILTSEIIPVLITPLSSKGRKVTKTKK